MTAAKAFKRSIWFDGEQLDDKPEVIYSFTILHFKKFATIYVSAGS